jgi:hypothetical protein
MRDIDTHENIRLATFNVKNMYTNIPTDKIKDTIGSILDHSHTDDTKKQEILKYYNIILDQNFFQYRERQYKQANCLAMGAPTSSIFSEIYLQYMKHTTFMDILNKKIYIYIRIFPLCRRHSNSL